MDALTRQLAQMNSGASTANTTKAVNAGNIFSCEHCGGMDHTTLECQLGRQESGLDQVNALNNFGRPQNYPYSNTYNSGWRNHPNFSYKNNPNMVPQQNNQNPPGFPQRQFNSQPAPQKSNLEIMMENFMIQQQKTTQDLRDVVRDLTTKVDSLTTQNKMLETQIAQQASSSRAPGKLPSQPEPNPREHHMKVVTLRSGKQIGD
jgi:hypothetical protein